MRTCARRAVATMLQQNASEPIVQGAQRQRRLLSRLLSDPAILRLCRTMVNRHNATRCGIPPVPPGVFVDVHLSPPTYNLRCSEQVFRCVDVHWRCSVSLPGLLPRFFLWGALLRSQRQGDYGWLCAIAGRTPEGDRGHGCVDARPCGRWDAFQRSDPSAFGTSRAGLAGGKLSIKRSHTRGTIHID